MPTHYLISIVPLKGHKDPDFRVPVYGDSGKRGERLRRNLSEGSYLFFHTSLGGEKYIVGYLCVSKAFSQSEAQNAIPQNCDAKTDDWCFVGDSRNSKRLKKLLRFDRRLADRLSLGIDFSDLESGKRSELQVIASATREHRELSEQDVAILKSEIEALALNHKIENSSEVSKYIHFNDETCDAIPFDEVHQIKEREIQLLIRKAPYILSPNFKLLDYEKIMPDGDRLDLLFEDTSDGSIVVAELKAPGKADNNLPTQVASYAADLKRLFPGRAVRKMIVCDGNVSPKLRKACSNLDIELFAYGLKLTAFPIKD